MTATATHVPGTMSGTECVPHPRPVRNSFTMGWRAVLRTWHEPEQMADAIAIPVLFTVMFTYLFGGALAGSPHRYLASLLPGTLVMAVLLVTVGAGLSLNTDRITGTLDRFRALPIWQPAVIIGVLLGDMARYTFSSVLVLGCGLLMGYRPAGGAGGALLAVALVIVFAFSVSWIWTTLGLLLRSPQAVSVISIAIQFPLTLASNAFVRPATMPGWLRGFVDVNPVSHLITAERSLMAGTASASQAGWVLLSSAGLIAVFGTLSIYLYRSRQ
jgi:ABC-2 type transport system permease protein